MKLNDLQSINCIPCNDHTKKNEKINKNINSCKALPILTIFNKKPLKINKIMKTLGNVNISNKTQ